LDGTANGRALRRREGGQEGGARWRGFAFRKKRRPMREKRVGAGEKTHCSVRGGVERKGAKGIRKRTLFPDSTRSPGMSEEGDREVPT